MNAEVNRKKVDLYLRSWRSCTGRTNSRKSTSNDAGEVSVVSLNEPLLVNLGAESTSGSLGALPAVADTDSAKYPETVQVDFRFENQVILRTKPDASDEREGDMGRREKIVVGLDIGSTKVCTLIAAERPSAASGLKPIGFGIAESKGMKSGAIVNLEATVESIKKSVSEAEAMAKCRSRARLCRPRRPAYPEFQQPGRHADRHAGA